MARQRSRNFVEPGMLESKLTPAEFRGATIDPQALAHGWMEQQTIYSEEDCRRVLEIGRLLERFLRTSNPVYGLQAFTAAVRAVRRPPEVLLDWLANSFDKFLDTHLDRQGTATLESIMGFSMGSGGTAPAEAAWRDERNDTMLTDMAKLLCLGASRKSAAEMVAAKAAASKEWNLTRWKNLDKKPSADTILHLYKRWDGRKIVEAGVREYWLPHARPVSFLETFPPSSERTRLLNRWATRTQTAALQRVRASMQQRITLQ